MSCIFYYPKFNCLNIHRESNSHSHIINTIKLFCYHEKYLKISFKRKSKSTIVKQMNKQEFMKIMKYEIMKKILSK